MTKTKYVVYEKTQDVINAVNKDISKSFIYLFRKFSKYSSLTENHFNTMLVIIDNMHSNNVFDSDKTSISQALGITTKSLTRIYKILEEINFWIKSPSNSNVYFVNPKYAVSSKNKNYIELLRSMYQRSKETKRFVADIKEYINKEHSNRRVFTVTKLINKIKGDIE